MGTSDNLDELMANYQAIAQKAWGATTYATTETTPRPVSFKDLTQGTIQAMYDEGNWPFLEHGPQRAQGTQHRRHHHAAR